MKKIIQAAGFSVSVAICLFIPLGGFSKEAMVSPFLWERYTWSIDRQIDGQVDKQDLENKNENTNKNFPAENQSYQKTLAVDQGAGFVSDSVAVPREQAMPKKKIMVYLDEQKLRYFEGYELVGEVVVATGLRGMDTPRGEFSVLRKLPVHTYAGFDYYYPNIKWNLEFKHSGPGSNLFIHGAPWNHHLGRPGSHGCVNVSYKDMEPLYNWAESGTEVIIQ